MARWIAGMDGCRGGWAAVLLDLDDTRRFRLAAVPRAEAILVGDEAPICVGIDIPIGLPERVGRGGRAADVAARAALGAGRASVFPMPGRAAVHAPTYAEAKDLARATADPPFAPSIQAWNIFPKVREVDALLRAFPALADRVFEVHPEVAFLVLNGGVPLAGGKRTPLGRAVRQERLLAAGLPPGLVAAPRPRGMAADDHLDALAGLVVARAIVEGSAVSLPDPPGRDAFGLPVAIWAPGPASGALP